MGRGRMDSKGWTLSIPSEVIDNWGIKCAGQSAHLMFQARRVGHHCPGRRFASSNEMAASGLLTRHHAFNSYESLFRLANNRNVGHQVSDTISRALSALPSRFILRASILCALNPSASIKSPTFSYFLHTPRILEFMLRESLHCPSSVFSAQV
ncbi:hypothetical protein Pyn_12553 [Prunus yedoensis var. nudiflora]|uniref:Uncharacterized protein n=1 Tax=Prunus yedoensis var. nudiflora TaxID=2094558 RepID=A0A314XIM3_PRUYE|nr:hypothetical protein Pyn_12553 [Prunus yedoensis var. nudiflora]